MEWKPIIAPPDGKVPQQDDTKQISTSSWHASGNRSDYWLVARKVSDLPSESDAVKSASAAGLGAEDVMAYMISRNDSTLAFAECVVGTSSTGKTGKRHWVTQAEYRVPPSELLLTAKAFCEFFDVEFDFPTRKTWKALVSVYLDVAAGNIYPPVRLVPEELYEYDAEENEEDDDEENFASLDDEGKNVRFLLWTESKTPGLPQSEDPYFS